MKKLVITTSIAFVFLSLCSLYIFKSVNAQESDIIWRDDLSTRSQVKSFAYGNGVYVSITDLGRIVISSDGVSWKDKTLEIKDMYYGSVVWCNDKFFVFGYRGTILISSDGQTWEIAETPTTMSVIYGAVRGNGEYIAVGSDGTILASKDGWHWEERTSGISDALTNVIWTGDKYVAIGQGCTIITSDDGISWSKCETNEHSTAICFYNAVWNGKCFVACGNANMGYGAPGCAYVIQTEDFVSFKFTQLHMGWPGNIAWDEKQFIMVSENGDLWVSDDGVEWEEKTPSTYLSGAVQIKDVILVDNNFIGISEYGRILTLKDGVQWTFKKPGRVMFTNTVYTGKKYVAAGLVFGYYSVQTIYTSDDGITWYCALPGDFGLDTVTYCDMAWNGKILAAILSGNIYVTNDGISWNKIPAEASDSSKSLQLLHIIWDGSEFTAIDYNGNMLKSKDGVKWDLSTIGIEGKFSGIACNGQIKVIVGDNGLVLTSEDGNRWTQVSTENLPALINFNDIAWNGNYFIASDCNGTAYISVDGTVWIEYSSISDKKIRYISKDGNKLYAINDNSDTPIVGLVQKPVSIILDGKQIQAGKSENPVMIQDRILVPIKVIENIGICVEQDNDVIMCSRNGETVELRIDDRIASKGCSEIIFDVPSQSVNGAVMLPLRGIAEALGLRVEWDGDDRAVIVTSK